MKQDETIWTQDGDPRKTINKGSTSQPFSVHLTMM